VDAGSWLVAYGFFAHTLDVPAGGEVLEIGAGPGGLTEILARGGLNVTAVERHHSNCDIIRNRVIAFEREIKVIHAPDTYLIDRPGTYDAVILYDSLREMPFPREMLMHFRRFLKPGGIFAFGAESILAAGGSVPFPWGLRLDGAALAGIRDFGRASFAIQEDFFVDLMKELGFAANKVALPGVSTCAVWIARPE
jgi:SAM-dependent methyltransferase